MVKKLKEVVNQINSLKIDKINAIDDGGSVKIRLNDVDYTLSSDDVEIYFEDIEGWLVASENGKTIALDTSINESLKNEGISREIVNRIQNLRKESNFNVSDKIIIELERNNLIEKAIFANLDYVKNETLAKELNFLDNLDSTSKIEFDDFSLGVKIYKIN